MPQINLLAVFLAALSGFVLGGIWYGPLFGRAWMAQLGFTMEELQKDFNGAKTYGMAFVYGLIAAYTFAIFLGPDLDLPTGALYGFTAGLAWVGTSFATSYQFERRSSTLLMINAGYHTVQFTTIGAILGAMS